MQSAAFLSFLATGVRERADMVSIPMREMTGVIPLSVIPHSVDYIQLVMNSPIVSFKLVVEAILFSNYIR